METITKEIQVLSYFLSLELNHLWFWKLKEGEEAHNSNSENKRDKCKPLGGYV